MASRKRRDLLYSEHQAPVGHRALLHKKIVCSSIAIEIGHAVARKLTYWDGPPYNIPEIIDAELQEMRDCLFEVVREHDDPVSDYGCTTHTTERARALLARLAVDKEKESNG